MRIKYCNILHITPHLGGGVGRVVLNYLARVKEDANYKHEVICLDYANENAITAAKKIDLKLSDNMAGNPAMLEAIAQADIVLIHWWNHPLLYDLLVRSELPASRVIMWSHVSGFHPPYVFTEKIFFFFFLFVFTTPVSHDTKAAKSLSPGQKESLHVVWATGGVEHVKNVKPQVHKGFNVGYIGTVDYCKMHPDFLKICSKVNVPGVKFIVCGGPKEKELAQEAKCLGIGNKFKLTGQVLDIAPYLAKFDVFGYPLAPHHYGTCDQVLAESMACGIVPVVLSNRMESHIVKNGLTGIVAKNKQEYIDGIEKLYSDPNLRSYLSANARDYALKHFSLESIEQEWAGVFGKIIQLPKTVRKWKIRNDGSAVSAKDVFLESLGTYGEPFKQYCNAPNEADRNKAIKAIIKLSKSPLWQAETKGTVYHYNAFFPEDNYLAIWTNLMRKINPASIK